MIYRTSNYLIDLYKPFGLLFIFARKTKKLILSELREIIISDKRVFYQNFLHNIPNAACIVFLGSLAVFKLASVTEKENGLRAINLTTGSMRPSIPIGTVVLTKPDLTYKIGDIVTYREVNPSTGLVLSKTFTHRIIDEKYTDEGECYVTKGDSNDLPDPHLVKKENILGKVFLIIPFVGYLVLLIKSLPGFVFLIAVPAISLIINEIKYIRSWTNGKGDIF